MTDCAIKRYRKRRALTKEELAQSYDLPCKCGSALLSDLLELYECEGCRQCYYYSFCMKDVVDEETFWHCSACGTCRETSEWHCDKCNTCTYGLTLACDECGTKSPYA